MHVAIVTTGLSRAAAGVHEAVRGQATHLPGVGGIRVTVLGVASQPDSWTRDSSAWCKPGVELDCVMGRGPQAILRLIGRARRTDYDRIDIVHAHGLWNGATVAGRMLATRYQCPLVVSPHGMLEPWAFRFRAYKKRLPWLLWERSIIASADLLQAMSSHELRGIRAHGFRNPAVVLPVGLDLSGRAGVVPRKSPGLRTGLFLSRIHPVKGLPLLLEAWQRLRPAGWRLCIAGPDEGGHRAELEALCRTRGITELVEFRGPTHGAEKWQLMADSDLFVLPSHSENFGIVVAEAMVAGLPVITTTGTPWKVLKDKGLGWWVDPDVDSIRQALHAALSLPPDGLAARGAEGSRYSVREFDWRKIAIDLADAYAWACHGGAAPAGVDLICRGFSR